jgi:hypothetical protein
MRIRDALVRLAERQEIDLNRLVPVVEDEIVLHDAAR